ncbi:hemolysin family protein [Desulfobacca acetoxidans]|uniref:CBS domain containing protein n=1 Tax=Desulfobacca acetoxidans (strain ATCC 700848 / DSM 11109 / ASRB2) TaxID=880072 RepID=F2ND15_DESAR|nr:hemolysin family protein [Desulfobacca acetoxidans]AEB09589.1 CBS domain containing protein [Desulfobacca acetoxidans DSM 11109]HAY21573.1 HlyC/CorC family transporter [Desulfobacterales bacterium]
MQINTFDLYSPTLNQQIWLKWTALALLLGCYSFFALAETSLFSLSPLARIKLKSKHPQIGGVIERLLSRSQRLLTTIIIGNEAAVIVATVLATSLSLNIWGDKGKWVAMGLMAPALLLFGEIIPKSLALRHPEFWARLIARPLTLVMPLFTPVRVVLLTLSRSLMSFFGLKPAPPSHLVREDDFLRMVEDSHKVGLIAPMERELIVNLMSLGETTVGQIMVPRPDIFYLPLSMKLAELIKAVKQARFSRVPIYGNDPEDIVGILHAKDLLSFAPEAPVDQVSLKKLLRPAYYVPENKRAFDLLGELQTRKIRLALVVDEYGSLIGLVSVEDILEELFGEFEEEFQQAGKLLEQLAPGVYLIKSRMPLDDLNQILGLTLPMEEFDTLGGFVFNLFGELPHEGDAIVHDGMKFEVLRMKGTRILELLLSLETS